MRKKFILLISVLVLSSVSASQALVVGDFEGGLDGWAPAGDATLTLSTTGATSGTESLLIEGPGSWQMLALLDIKAIRSVLAVDGAAVSADVTAFAEDMETDWMNMEMIINGQNNDDNGANNNIGWQSLGGLDIVRDGVTQTLYWELPADLSAKIAGTDDNIAWFELFIVTNNGAANTKIYIDNIQLIGAELEPEPEPATGPTIAWVSYHAADDEPHADAAAVGFTQAPDIGYTDLLSANGYDVTRVLTSQTPDVEYLNTFDLVIISRTASSGHYSGSGATLWNSITAPMMNLNGYTLRSSRLGFTDGTDMPDTTGDVRLAVTDPAHPIFDGIALTDGVMDNMYAAGAVPLPPDPSIISRGISINNNTPDNDGTVLATIAEVSADTGPVGGMVIAEWPAGAIMENSSGSPDDVLGGPRLVFLTGSREPDGVTGGQAAALYDLYPDGEKMFLNAVKYMIPVEPVDPGTDGLVAYYALENDATDSSGNGLDGTIVGDPVFVEGAMGMGLQLDGVDDYVDLGNDPLFDITEQVTLSVWVNTQDIGNTQDNPWLGKGDTSYMIKGFRTGNQIEFFIYDGGWNSSYADVGDSFNGEWHHAAGTFNGQQLLVYVDGKLSGSLDYVGGIAPSTYNVAIGTNTQASGRFSESILDEAAIYSRALSEGEILYLAGERVPVEPVHSYTFEDGTGNDSVGDADGVLVGDAAIADGSLVVDGDGDWMEMPGDVIAINTYSEVTLELWSTQSVDNPFSMTASFGGTWDNGMGKDYIFIATGRGDQMNRGAIANTPDEVNPWEDEVGVSSPELNDGIEHQYVLTITAEELAYYVDGVLIGTAPMGGTAISGVSNDFVFLGKGIYSVDPTMNCSINEFNIYDVALSAEQIVANFAEGPVK